jgi:hypothetical protein
MYVVEILFHENFMTFSLYYVYEAYFNFMNEVEWVIIKGRLAQRSYFACRANSTNARDGEREKKNKKKAIHRVRIFSCSSFFS